MNNFLQIIYIASPLLLLTIGALISEYAGRMAIFLDGIINLGGFLFFTFTVKSGMIFPSVLLSVFACSLLVFLTEKIASSLNANMFLVSLSLNIFSTALVSLLSSVIFSSRGILFSKEFIFSPGQVRIISSVICLALSFLTIVILKHSRLGLQIRISGSDANVLDASGTSSKSIISFSWIIASAFAALVGVSMTMRISSYVPGLSSGRGWTALAAVFLGKKNPLLILLAVVVFALGEFLSTNIQNISFFENIPSSVLLSLPYLLALFLITIIPQKK